MIRTRVPVRVVATVVAVLSSGACGSGGPSTAVPSTVLATTTTSTVTSVARTTTVLSAVPTTGLYVPPSSATSPTVARTTTTTAPWSGTPATMGQLLDGLARSLAATDGVVHLTKVGTWEGSFTATVTTEAWIDGGRQLARSSWTSGSERRASVLRDGVEYWWPPTMPNHVAVELPTCLGAAAIVRMVVDCPNGQLTRPYTVERETVDGHDAITFVSRQIIEPREVDRRESFDVVTLLPVRTVDVSTSKSEPYRSTTTWESEVVARTSLADGFFTPEAIGVELPTIEQLMAVIPTGTPVYWLGATSEGSAAGSLVLSTVEWSGMVAMLFYDVPDRRYAMPPALRIDVSPGEAGAAQPSGVPSCAGTPVSRVGAATAVFRCPGEPTDRLILELGFPDAVVRIESPYRCDGQGEGEVCTPGPLNDTDSLLAVASALVRR